MDPSIVKNSITYLVRGGISLAVDEVKDRYRTKNRPELPEGSLEFVPLPSLDDARLGDSLAAPETAVVAPENLFDVVVGMQYEKNVLRKCAESDRGIDSHVLIIGPPGSAKSLLLDELKQLDGTHYVIGRTATSAGLIALFVDKEGNVRDDAPRILLVDEIEKTDPGTLTTLHGIMDQHVTRAVGGKPAVDEPVDVRVIAAGNSTKGIPDSLLSRFWILELPAYTPAQRKEVIVETLTKRRGMTPEDANEIADLVVKHGGDLRDAGQVATRWQEDPELARDMASRLGAKSGR